MKKIAFCLSLFCACGSIVLNADEAKNSLEITVPVVDRAKFDSNPFTQLKKSLDAAEASGRGKAGVLATADRNGTPYTRVMHIGKITSDGIVFFTNKDSGKWKHMGENQKASFDIYFPASSTTVVINGVVDLSYNDSAAKDVDLTINGQKSAFKWGSFLFKPTEIIFSEISSKDDYSVEQSYAYKKGTDGNWVLSDKVKYYVSPK